MFDRSVNAVRSSTRGHGLFPDAAKLRAFLVHCGAVLLARLLGTADGRAVGVMARRELALILRSREWHRFLGMWVAVCAGVIALPILFRAHFDRWQHPTDTEWAVLCGYALQVGLFAAMNGWTITRLQRDLYNNRLDELMLTQCSVADIAMGEALASAVASLWLVVAALPVCLFVTALGGLGAGEALRLAVTLAPAGALGVWFGMGWALTFALRRPTALVSMTKWWIELPFLPVWAAWAVLGILPVVWALLSLIPGGQVLLNLGARFLAFLHWAIVQAFWHWNPALAVGAVAGIWRTTWVTDWAALLLLTLFMMRTSMDSVQSALSVLPECNHTHAEGDAWIHHDVHYFIQYGEEKRRQPKYYDGGNPVSAFDVALGHRVYLHPVLWAVVLLFYLFTLGWGLLVPGVLPGVAIAAVLTPATMALLMMSGGVAISFGWERDQHRWPSLAVLPMSNHRLAWGKIKGVVRPTLWLNLIASLTALILGWRGALDAEASLWMALHVLVFPVALAFVSATLALTTPTVSEALYRWAVLGAIPSVLYTLPAPVGGDGGWMLPFTPPLLVLILVLKGPTPELVQGAWASLGLEVVGIAGSLVILSLFLRKWTVGEKD